MARSTSPIVSTRWMSLPVIVTESTSARIPRSRAANPLTSSIFKLLASLPVLSVTRTCDPKTLAVTSTPAALFISSNTSCTVVAEDRSTSADAPLRSVTRMVPSLTPLPLLRTSNCVACRNNPDRSTLKLVTPSRRSIWKSPCVSVLRICCLSTPLPSLRNRSCVVSTRLMMSEPVS